MRIISIPSWRAAAPPADERSTPARGARTPALVAAAWNRAAWSCAAWLALLGARAAAAADDARAALDRFENEIRPVLAKHCVKCHGPDKAESSLRLDTRDGALRGGDGGPAISPGKPGESLLLKAVRHAEGLAMPPGQKLAPREIAAFERWIADGAVWPDGAALASGPALRGGAITPAERAFWSFQPVADPAPPSVDAATPTRNPIDQFVGAQLAAEGLKPRPPADKRALLRRATFDLIGLPPTPAEIAAFLADDSPDAFSRVVDRLLASPGHGERWGRHWLDVVRYADTAGETADYPTPLAYKYRNWVIRAINADLPYDEFVRRQVAGDLLATDRLAGRPVDDATLAEFGDLCAATGFIAISRRFGFDVENYHHLTIQDTIDVLGQAVLGLTLGCARCHDHKYDPVNMADYYAWHGVFASTRYSFPGSEQKHRPYDLFPALPPPLVAERQARFSSQLAALTAEIAEAEAQAKRQDDPAAAAAGQQRARELTARKTALAKSGPFAEDELVYGAVDAPLPADARVHVRGEPTTLGESAPRRNLEILGGEPVGAGSGRRELAAWLTRRDNPLTARVAVNRVWQHHFGRGLVATENDFGARGEPPSHPELLDWLARRFVSSGWSMKALHRLILESAAYQRAGDFDAAAAERDPENRWLWRFAPRRLSAEETRDAMLSASGELDLSMGGKHPFPHVDSWGFTQHAPFQAVYDTNRRGVYLMQQRLKRHPYLALFDGADPNVATARRNLTTTPTQALFLMNSEFVHVRAERFAARAEEAARDPAARLTWAWRVALGRDPRPDEAAEAAAFLAECERMFADGVAPPATRERLAWQALARTLLTRNEFLFVD